MKLGANNNANFLDPLSQSDIQQRVIKEQKIDTS